MKHLNKFNESNLNKGEMIYYTKLQDYQGEERKIIEDLVDDVQNGYAELVTIYENEEEPSPPSVLSYGKALTFLHRRLRQVGLRLRNSTTVSVFEIGDVSSPQLNSEDSERICFPRNHTWCPPPHCRLPPGMIIVVMIKMARLHIDLSNRKTLTTRASR